MFFTNEQKEEEVKKELAPTSLPTPQASTATQKGEALQDRELAIVAGLADGEGGAKASSIDSKDTVVFLFFFFQAPP
jgi:hypothetical protein